MARPAKIKQRRDKKNKNSKKNTQKNTQDDIILSNSINTQDDIIFSNSLWNSLSLEEGKSLSDYPEEIIFNILVRLPAASLYELRRVCKNWLHIISSPCFIQSHLAGVQPYIIERTPISNNEIHSFDVKDSEIRVRNLAIGCDCMILANCNGLLLVIDYPDFQDYPDIRISNPATKQLLPLPTCSTSSYDDYELLHYFEYGRVVDLLDEAELDFYRFGYAASTMEYKVVHFFHDGNQQSCEIITLGSDSWRRIDGPFRDLPLIFEEQLVLNGVLHWVVCYDYIMSMDVAQETFDETPIPSCITQNYRTLDLCLMEIRGYPSLMNRISNAKFEVWILKDFQIKEWINLYNIYETAGLRNLFPLPCLRNDDEVIFQSHVQRTGRLVLSTYDLKLQKIIQVKLYPRQLQDSPKITHFDTLVSLKFQK